MNIAVYLGSKFGTDKNIEKECIKLGEFIGKNKHSLVYGGSDTGLMHTLATSVKNSGGRIVGIEMKLFHDSGCSYSQCDEFIVTETLAERKKLMMEKSDAFIALPGGTGTLDEITEIMCLDKLNETHKPILLLNIDGFYDDLNNQLKKMVSFGFLTDLEYSLISFPKSVDEAVELLKK